MPSDGGRRGRRDNGLDAAAYVPLADVDPRVGEHLLDVLGSAGVPAYLEPSADVEPYTRALSLPSPPTDRLWVDSAQRAQAREIVDAAAPHGTRPQPGGPDEEPSHGLADSAEERAWREIVAGWDTSTAPATGRGRTGVSPVPPWPEVDEQPGPDGADREPPERRGVEPDSDPAGRSRPVPTAADLDAAAEAAAAAREAAEDDEVWLDGVPPADEEHYEPPAPPPVPRPSRQALLGALVVAFGIVLIAVPGLIGFDDRTGLTLGVFCILGGGALLVLRLRQTRADDGPDDGAIV